VTKVDTSFNHLFDNFIRHQNLLPRIFAASPGFGPLRVRRTGFPSTGKRQPQSGENDAKTRDFGALRPKMQ
jgi:hypothetical protein